jgi:hypothetical protein
MRLASPIGVFTAGLYRAVAAQGGHRDSAGVTVLEMSSEYPLENQGLRCFFNALQWGSDRLAWSLIALKVNTLGKFLCLK